MDEIHYIFRTNRTKTYCKPNLNDRRRPTTMSGHEPEKASHCLCLLLLWSTRFCRFPPPRRRQAANQPPMFTPPSLASTEWSSGGLPGTRVARPTMYYSSSLPAAPAHARRLRGRGGGGRPGGCRRSPSFAPATVRRRELWSAPGAEPPMSLVCSCDSTSKRASERQEAMVGVVPTEGRDRRRISVGLWLWLGVGAKVNIAGELQ